MGMICRGHNLPYLTAVQAHLETHGIPVLVQDIPGTGLVQAPGGRILTVPDADHDRAMKLLRDANLDPAKSDLSPHSFP